jgi:hypothetical protein
MVVSPSVVVMVGAVAPIDYDWITCCKTSFAMWSLNSVPTPHQDAKLSRAAMAVGNSDLRLIDLSTFGLFFMLTVKTQKSVMLPVPGTARKVKGDFWPRLFVVMIVFVVAVAFVIVSISSCVFV